MTKAKGTKPTGRPPVSLRHRFWSKVVTSPVPTDCWKWKGKPGIDGYGKIMGPPPEHKTLRAHRVSWELFNGPIPEGFSILHTCDTPTCTNPIHLFLGIPSENSRDMVDKTRQARGKDNGRSKLTDDDVRDIRRQYNRRSHNQVKLASEYGVSQAIISSVILRRSWKHVA